MAGFREPILHVDMDAFFVEVERMRDPALRGIPVAVGGTGGRGVVASASYEARVFGVRSAMPTSRALRLCPQLTMVSPDHRRYGEVSERVFSIFRDTTPLVEGLSVDEAFLDVSGLRLHRASPMDVATGIRSRLRQELGLPASVGIAASKFVAKLASEEAKPDGIFHVTFDNQLEFLHPLPVGRLWGVGEATQAALARLGVTTIAELAACEARALERALGPGLAGHLMRLAAGDDPRPIVPDRAVKSISVEHTYERDLQTDDEVVAAVRVHADRVSARLRRAGVEGRTVTLKVRFPDFTTVTRSETLAAPTATDQVILASALRLLAKVDRGDRGVRLLGLAIDGLSSVDDPAQLRLGGDDRWRRIDAAVDAIRDRFGAASVRPGTVDDSDFGGIGGSSGAATETDANVY